MQLTSTMLEPIVTAITDNMPVILTAGLGILATTLVIRLVPKYIKGFIK